MRRLGVPPSHPFAPQGCARERRGPALRCNSAHGLYHLELQDRPKTAGGFEVAEVANGLDLSVGERAHLSADKVADLVECVEGLVGESPFEAPPDLFGRVDPGVASGAGA